MNLNLKARTVKEITGSVIKTIPIGTEIVIKHGDPEKFGVGWEYSFVTGLEEINMLWDDEFSIILE
jgi:hypothetical protein